MQAPKLIEELFRLILALFYKKGLYIKKKRDLYWRLICLLSLKLISNVKLEISYKG